MEVTNTLKLDAWIAKPTPLARVNDNIKTGETNTIAIVCLNKQGPGGIAGPVKRPTRFACGSN